MSRNNLQTTLLVMALAGVVGCGGDSAADSAAQADSVRIAAEAATAAETARRQAADSTQRVAAAAARTRTTVEERIHFNFNRATIRAEARPILTRKVEALRASPATRIRIVGHTSRSGTNAYNQRLGMRRANAAKQFMVDAGIASARIEVASMGKTQLLDAAITRAAGARNRRAEFQVLP